MGQLCDNTKSVKVAGMSMNFTVIATAMIIPIQCTGYLIKLICSACKLSWCLKFIRNLQRSRDFDDEVFNGFINCHLKSRGVFCFVCSKYRMP